MYDPHTRESRGFGFIRMASTEEADRAITAVNGTDVDGRIVTVEKVKREELESMGGGVNDTNEHVFVVGKAIASSYPYTWSLLWSSQTWT